jgi:hypothetical protein
MNEEAFDPRSCGFGGFFACLFSRPFYRRLPEPSTISISRVMDNRRK